jgi:hypothetical protein
MIQLSLPAYTALALLEQSGRIYMTDHDLVGRVGQALGLIALDDETRDYDEEYAISEALTLPALAELEAHDLVFRGADGGGAFPLTGIHPNGIKDKNRAAQVKAALALGPAPTVKACPVPRLRLSALAV